MRRPNVLYSLVFSLVLLSLAACGDDPTTGSGTDIECSDDSQCPDGSCINGFCEPDAPADRDGDGVADVDDNCPDVGNPDQADLDTDGVGDACDVCVDVADPDQADADGDGEGDACETIGGADRDGDGVDDVDDNCPDVSNPDQADLDDDGEGDRHVRGRRTDCSSSRATVLVLKDAWNESACNQHALRTPNENICCNLDSVAII